MEHTQPQGDINPEELLHGMTDAFVSTDRLWRYRYVNKKALALMGKTKEQLIGNTIWDVFPGIIGTDFELHYRKVMEQRVEATFEAFCEESSTWLEVHVLPNDGGVSIFCSDITEKKKALAIIKDSERWFRNVADNSPLMIWSANVEKQCNYFNNTWLRFRGRAERQEFGMGWTNGIHEEDKQRVLKIFSEAFDERTEFRTECRLLYRDESYRWVSFSGKPLFAPDHSFMGFGGTCVDIDEQVMIYRQMEVKVAERTSEFTAALEREKELNSQKSKFVSIASHEFRTPLSTILSSVGLMELYYSLGDFEQMLKHMERIKGSIKHMINILNDFLSLDKLEQGEIKLEHEYLNFEEFARETVEELHPILKPQQEIICRYKGEKNVHTDKKVMYNVLMNLLSNAIKYSDKDIILEIRVAKAIVNISVTDEGIGIPPDEHQMLFKKYFRAGNVGKVKGTGLGLNIVQRFIELLGGTISFASIQDKGTTFTVRVPNQ